MDCEFRILLTGDGPYPEDVIVWATDLDGQWGVLDHWQIGPFATKLETSTAIARRVMNTWAELKVEFGLS
ncbi:MAG: hypothetical protein ACRDHG_15210 [Anaerolineales bacterium]